MFPAPSFGSCPFPKLLESPHQVFRRMALLLHCGSLHPRFFVLFSGHTPEILSDCLVCYCMHEDNAIVGVGKRGHVVLLPRCCILRRHTYIQWCLTKLPVQDLNVTPTFNPCSHTYKERKSFLILLPIAAQPITGSQSYLGS